MYFLCWCHTRGYHLFQCWKQEFPFDNDFVELREWLADTNGVYSSQGISRLGGLVGYFPRIEIDVSIRYIQGDGGKEYLVLAINFANQAVRNRTYDTLFYFPKITHAEEGNDL